MPKYHTGHLRDNREYGGQRHIHRICVCNLVHVVSIIGRVQLQSEPINRPNEHWDGEDERRTPQYAPDLDVELCEVPP